MNIEYGQECEVIKEGEILVLSPGTEYHYTASENSGINYFNSAINPVISQTLAPRPEDSVNPMQVIVFAAAVVWIAGVVAMLIYSLISFLKIRKKV